MNQPSFTLEMGEFKFEMSRQILDPGSQMWLYQKVIKRSIGEDYFNKTTYFIFDDENAGENAFEMPFQVVDVDHDEETNMRGEDFIEFKQKWNESPIATALANIGLAGISRME